MQRHSPGWSCRRPFPLAGGVAQRLEFALGPCSEPNREVPVPVNKARQSFGVLWQKGLFDRALRREEDLKAMARYIVANPLRAGLVEHIGQYPYGTPSGYKTPSPVGASLLAMNVNDNAVRLVARGVFAFFASKLAPTGAVVSCLAAGGR